MARIEHIGHSTFRLTGELTVYIDPYKLAGPQIPADIVFITHGHFDHCSPSDLALVCTPSTVVFGTPDCEAIVKQLPMSVDFRSVEPDRDYEYAGVKVRTIPAYNINKKFHPRANKWVGYLIGMEGEEFYHPGDTDLIPEMSKIHCDYAFLPVSGTYVMTADEAAEAFNLIRPRKGVFPMHYGVVVGTQEDAKRFLALIEHRSKE